MVDKTLLLELIGSGSDDGMEKVVGLIVENMFCMVLKSDIFIEERSEFWAGGKFSMLLV